jgi:hypothetical protein
MVSIEVIALVLTGLGLTASIVYYANILNNANKTQQMQLETRQAQLFMQIYNQWNTSEFGLQYEKCMSMEWRDFDDFENKILNTVEAANTWRMVTRFFEGIGVLVHRGLVDVTLVDDLMSGEMTRFWEKFEPVIREIRIIRDWPQAIEWTEYLYEEIRKIMEKQHPELTR